MRHAIRADLAELGADLDRHLGLHQLTRDQRDRVTHEITVLTGHHTRNDISSSYPSPFRHSGCPSSRLLVEPAELDPNVVRTLKEPGIPATKTPGHHHRGPHN